MQQLTIIKVGGKIVEEESTLTTLIKDFSKIEGYKILVHGGGKSATKIASRLGIESKMVDGRRITDAEMLKVVTMVYAGLVNKNIVAKLQATGINALGMTGADLNIIQASKRPIGNIDYGFVGDIKSVNAETINQLIESGITPVLAPITHDMEGNLLNTNADTIAAETAQSLSSFYKVTLVYCFEKTGVLLDENDDSSVIPTINESYYNELKEKRIVTAGMIPKIDNAFNSLRKGVSKVIITHPSDLEGKNGSSLHI